MEGMIDFTAVPHSIRIMGACFMAGLFGSWVGSKIFYGKLGNLNRVLANNEKLLKGAKTRAKINKINQGRKVRRG